MTRPDALRTILRAQTYLTYLSLEDAGTGHESRLADELGEALKVLSEPEPRKWTWNCGVCGLKISGDIAGCPNCLPKIDPADTPTRAIPAAEMIRVEPVGRCEVCGWTLALDAQDGCVPGNCSYRPEQGSEEWHRIQQRKRELAKQTGQTIIDGLAARTETVIAEDAASAAEAIEPRRCRRCSMPIEAHRTRLCEACLRKLQRILWMNDRSGGAQSACGRYDVTRTMNGWLAAVGKTADDMVDCTHHKTAEDAKAWCENIHAGRLVDTPADGALLNGQAVKVAASEIPF